MALPFSAGTGCPRRAGCGQKNHGGGTGARTSRSAGLRGQRWLHNLIPACRFLLAHTSNGCWPGRREAPPRRGSRSWDARARAAPGLPVSDEDEGERMGTSTPEWSTVPAAGSRVIVTGAAGGLGRALTSALLELGSEVVGVDQPGTESLAGLRLVSCDLTDQFAARRAIVE